MIIPSREFTRQFKRLDGVVQRRVIAKVEEVESHLGDWPHERLTNRPECKLRVGDWRVLYRLDLSECVIHLLGVGHRREIYR